MTPYKRKETSIPDSTLAQPLSNAPTGTSSCGCVVEPESQSHCSPSSPGSTVDLSDYVRKTGPAQAISSILEFSVSPTVPDATAPDQAVNLSQVTGLIPGYTFTNGLTKTGVDVKFGGALIEDTGLTLNGNQFYILSGNSSYVFDPTYVSLHLTPNINNLVEFFMSPSDSYWSQSVNSNVNSIQFRGFNGMIVTDSYLLKGLQYAGNYGVNFTARSLIDKEYADGAYAPITGGGYVPNARTLTINGTTYDLSANRTWTVGDALVANPLSQFALTTSTQLAGIISDETGTGVLVFNNSPVFVTPNLGTPSVLIGTNITGTAASLAIGGSAGSVVNALTFNNGGAGVASGTTFNGSVARTISYNTVGAAPLTGGTNYINQGTSAVNQNFNLGTGSGIATKFTSKNTTTATAGLTTDMGFLFTDGTGINFGVTYIANSNVTYYWKQYSSAIYDAMTLDRSGILYVSGNVQIGNSTPTAGAERLQVAGTISQTSVTSALLKTSSTGVLVAAIAGTDYAVGSGSTAYIQNGTSQQASSNFNISGNGTIGTNLVVTGTQTNTGTIRVNNWIGINTAPGTHAIDIRGTTNTSSNVYGVFVGLTYGNSVTSNVRGFGTALNIASGGAVADVEHFIAQSSNFNSVVPARQAGFKALSSLTGASLNYGFQGQIDAGTGRYNLYMDGTAVNFLNGNLQVGSNTATVGTEKLQVTGNISISSGIHRIYGSNVGIGSERWFGANGGTGTYINTPSGTTTQLGVNNVDILTVAGTGVSITGAGSISGNAIISGTTQMTGIVGIGAAPSTNINIFVSGTMAGTGTTTSALDVRSTIPATATSQVYLYNGLVSTAAASFTANQVFIYNARTNVLGAGSAINNLYMFSAADPGFTISNLTVGFYGQVSSGSTKWNLYMSGTAANYINGNLQLGSTTPTAGAEKLQVSGSASISTNLAVGGTISAGNTFTGTYARLSGAVTYTAGNPGSASEPWVGNDGGGPAGGIFINAAPGSPVRVGVNNQGIALVDSTGIYPNLDNSYSNGLSSKRWSTVYGVAGNFTGTVGIGGVLTFNNSSGTVGATSYTDYGFGGGGITQRDALTLVTSTTADRYWYSYIGFGYQNILYMTAGGSLRIGQMANATGDGSGHYFQVQQGSDGGFSYAASFTTGGPTNAGNGVALGGSGPGDTGMIKAYNTVSGTIKPLQIDATRVSLTGLLNLKNYTVGALPSGTRGDIAYVTDALAPSYLVAVVGGGSIVTPVFHNGTTWVAI